MGQSVSKSKPKPKHKKTNGTKKNVKFTYTASVCKYNKNGEKFNCTRKVVSKGMNNNTKNPNNFNSLLSNFLKK